MSLHIKDAERWEVHHVFACLNHLQNMKVPLGPDMCMLWMPVLILGDKQVHWTLFPALNETKNCCILHSREAIFSLNAILSHFQSAFL